MSGRARWSISWPPSISTACPPKRSAHRFERLQLRRGEDPAGQAADRERAALVGFLRRLLDSFAMKEEPWGEGALSRSSTAEVDRLVGVAMTVLSQEAAGR